jgi:hypothetical protein
MSDAKKKYPLSWPDGWKRTAPSARKRGQFGRTVTEQGAEGAYGRKAPLSISVALDRIAAELRALDVGEDDMLISTNIPTRLDGLPRSDRGEPGDPGVAVYWVHENRHECMAIDIYDRVADNLGAVAATLNALRAIERHGGRQIQERTFRGFAALPETTSGRSWRDVLNFHPTEKVTREDVKERFTAIARKRHPDAGGSEESFRELIWARDAAYNELDQNGKTAVA